MIEYRIRNIDKNLQIQRKINTKDNQDKWQTISYHGQSLNSLICGLSNLLARDFKPEGGTLLDQIESIRLELVSSLDRIEKVVKEYCD